MTEDYSQEGKLTMNILSGNMLDTGELVEQVRNNMGFRISSAREMITGIRDESAMSPMERRRQLRQNRLSLIGMGSDDDVSASAEDMRSTDTSQVSSGSISTSSTSRRRDSVNSNPSQVPSMDEVDRGTKSRAEESGFSQTN